MVDAAAAARPLAWVSCYDATLHAYDENGALIRCTAGRPPPPQPATHVHYGGPSGDAAHELLTREEAEERLSFTLRASLIVGTPELLRSLPLLNLEEAALPPELVAPASLRPTLAAAIREGRDATRDVYVAPDDWGGYGLYAAAELEPMALVGEYVGAIRREAEAATPSAEDPYVMRYPDASGDLHVSARDAGSLMRFVNHAPRSSPANNCTVSLTCAIDPSRPPPIDPLTTLGSGASRSAGRCS